MITFQESDADAGSNTFATARTTKSSVDLICGADGIYEDELTAGLNIFDKII